MNPSVISTFLTIALVGHICSWTCAAADSEVDSSQSLSDSSSAAQMQWSPNQTGIDQFQFGQVVLPPSKEITLDPCDSCLVEMPSSSVSYLFRVLPVVKEYLRVEGHLPVVLNGDTIKTALRDSPGITPELIESLMNPLDGKPPRLDCLEQSPGDFYVKVLSDEEKQALLDAGYCDWTLRRPVKFLSNEAMATEFMKMEVIYYRLYGQKEVISAGIL